jgi:GNAT superfamily N-acetyltransferase
MLATAVRIEPLDPHAITEAEIAAMHVIISRSEAERFPSDPPRPLEQTAAIFRSIPPFFDLRFWTAWRDDRTTLLGYGVLIMPRTEENQHAAQIEMEVLPEARRQGLGQRLLAPMVDAAAQAGRRLLILSTNSNQPGGAAFMERLGASAGLVGHINQLVVADLDRAMLRAWQERAETRAPDFTLGLWEGAYPEAHLDEIAALFQAMNLAPRGDLDVEDFRWTPEQMRQIQDMKIGRGGIPWTMYLRDNVTGELAGFTEINWNPSQPAVVWQGGTAVGPKYRNQGLGRRLKAAMLEKVLRERPEGAYVRTENADSNAAMLKINQELGFRPYYSNTMWQVPVDQVRSYLRTA